MTDHASARLAEIETLADKIATTAATVDATMHQLLSYIRKFDDLKGWARQGAKSLAHWLSWRIGESIGAAREKVRVARALGELPKVDAALAEGKLSWAKVRAMTRVARPEIEERLMTYAEHSTGAQMERICRGFRKVERICETGRKSAAKDDERFVHRRHLGNGMVRIEAQLTADEAELVMRALDEARGRAKKKLEKKEEREATHADALVLMAENVLASAPKARSGGTRNQICVHLTKDETDVPAGTSWRAVLADGSWLSGDALLRLACDAGIVMAKKDGDGNVLDVGRRLRTVSPSLLRALHVRDGGCRFPGCTSRAFVDAHHIVHWAHGGETSLANTVLLCSTHHHLVHEGGYRIDRWPDGSPMFLDPEGDVIDAVGVPVKPGLPKRIDDPKVNLPRWYGQKLDLGVTVQGLVVQSGLAQWRIPAGTKCAT